MIHNLLHIKLSVLCSRKGFTVVELLVYMGIFIILLSVLFTIFGAVLDTRLGTDSFSAVQEDGNYLLARLSYDVERASSVTTPSALGGQGSTMVLVIAGSNYTYASSSGNLQLTNASGTSNLNSYGTNISSFNIIRYGNPGGVEDSLKINITLTGKSQRTTGLPDTKAFQTTISLRRN